MSGTEEKKEAGGVEGSGTTPKRSQKEKEPLSTIEEHAAALQVSAPVFAGVRQSMRWAEGKRVSEAEFKKAVGAFLNAPMGGRR